MRLLVDGDACPVKDVLLRAAHRLDLPLILVSNKPMAFGREAGVTAVIVPEGPDAADRWIVEAVTPADLVVTADIPLAAEVVARGAVALGHRGEIFDEASIGERMATWNLHRTLREQGLELGGPKAYGPRDVTAFASAFERLVRRLQKR
ncbi:MAG TPA: YaiI/YqxD family protein [Oscillatoriaceae cyanobacterium]